MCYKIDILGSSKGKKDLICKDDCLYKAKTMLKANCGLHLTTDSLPVLSQMASSNERSERSTTAIMEGLNACEIFRGVQNRLYYLPISNLYSGRFTLVAQLYPAASYVNPA